MTEKIRVLYVDDEPGLLDIGKVFLEESGDFTVTTAISAPEALRLLEQEQFDTIISDYMMPGMDGIQFLVEVRTRFGAVPFILFTGKGREEVVIQAINSGADFYLQKGGNPQAQFAELIHKIKSAASRKRADDSLRNSEEQHRTILQTTLDGIWMVNAKGKITDVNETYCRMSGYTRAELLNLHVSDLDAVEKPAETAAHLKSIVDNGSGIFESSHRRKDGSVFDVEVSTTYLNADGGKLVCFCRDITERKRAEEALRTSEEKFRKAFFTSPDSICITRLSDGLFVSINKGFTEITGYTEEDVAGKTSLEINIWKDPEDRRKIVEGLKAHGEVRNYEARFLTKTGEIYGSMSTSIIELNGVPHILNITHDLSERKKAEEALMKNTEDLHSAYEELTSSDEELRRNVNDLAKSEQSLRALNAYNRSLLEAGLDSLVIINPDGKIADVNTSTEKITGYSREELIGTDFSYYFTEPEQAKEGYQRTFTDGTVRNYPLNIRNRDGHITPVLYSATVYRDENGKVSGVFAAARDITERKRAEEAHRQSEKKFRLIAETIDEAFWMADVEIGKIFYVSPSFERIWGLSRECLYNNPRSFLDAIHKEDRERVLVDLEIEKTGQPFDHEYRIVLPDGNIRNIWDRGFPIRDETGQISTYVGIAIDITERKRAEAAITESFAIFKTVMDSLDALVYVSDMKTHEILFINKYGKEIFGDITGKICWKSIQVDQNGPCPFCTNEKLLDKEGNPAGIVIWEFKNTINGHWYECHDNAIRWTDGRIVRIEIATDITDRKQVDEVLRGSEERFRGLVETITSGVAIYEVRNNGASGKDYIIKDFNKTALEIEGKKKDEVIGKSLSDLRPAIDEYGLIPVFQQVWETGVPAYFPQNVYIDEKYSNWYENRVFRLQSGEIVAVYDDVTERKRAEEELKHLSEFQDGVITNARVWLSVLDLKGRILLWNMGAEELSGYTSDEVVGQKEIWKKIYPDPEYRKQVTNTITRIIRDKNYLENFETTIISKKGDNRVISWNTKGIPDATGRVSDYIAIGVDVTERKRAEEELRFHAEIERNMSDAVYLIRVSDGIIVYSNPSFEKLFGYDQGELIGKHVSVINAPVDKEPGDVADEIMSSLSTTGTWSGEVLNIRKDGTTFWSFANVITFDHPRFGKVWLSMHNDITEHKWAEQALVKSEARHRTILQTTTDGFYVINSVGKVADVNETYCSMSGYTRAELLKLGIADLDAVEEPAGTEERIRRIITNGSEIFETCHRRKDGSVFDVELSVTYQKADGGLFISFCRDITERKRAEETLVLKTSQMTLAQQMAKVGYWSFDIADGIPVWSDMMFEVFGRDPAKSVPHYANHRDFIHPDDWAIFDDAVKGAVKGIPYNIIIRVIFSDGSVHFVTTQGYPQRDSRGKIASLFGTSQDITDRKRAEQALQEANKKLNLLSSITRHDISNQLTILMGYLTILEKQQPDTSFSDYFQKVSTAAGRISAMIRFTKEYEQIGVNAPAWQDCRTLVDTAAMQAPLGMVLVKNDLPAGMETFADPLVVKVFYNLMDNAVRYGGKITTIRFFTLESGDAYIIMCEDDGNGIPAEEKEKIFERGYGKNTGLGLALSKEILDITGITIKETGEPGKGARFEMMVPKGMYR